MQYTKPLNMNTQGRKYSKELLARVFAPDSEYMRAVKERRALIKVVFEDDDGRMDLNKAAALVESVVIDSNGVPQVTFNTLTTPQGNIVAEILKDEKNVVYLATFGHGTCGDDKIVQDDYTLNYLGFVMPQARAFTADRLAGKF